MPSGQRDLSSYRSKRRPGRTPEPIPAAGRGARQEHGETLAPDGGQVRGPVVRHPGAPCQHAPLGLPSGAGRGAGVMGPSQGSSARSGPEPPGRPDRGPSARVRILRRDHPAGRVRRRSGDHLGFGVPTTARSGPTGRSMVRLHGGGQAQGHYVLFRTGDDRWMIHRMDPPPSGWEPPPGQGGAHAVHPGVASRER